MERLAVVFRLCHTNRYSFLALEAGMQAAGASSRVDVVHSRQTNPDDFLPQLDSLLQSHSRVLVAYSIMTAQRESVQSELRRLLAHRERHRMVLVGGGPHAAGSPKSCLAEGLDAVCTGEGETAFPQLVDHLQGNGALDSFASPGFYLSVNGNVRFTGRAAPVSLERIPPLPLGSGRFGPIEISRGCPFRCKYCQTPVLKGTRMRHRPLEAIVDTVRRMAASGRCDARFITPNALAYESADGRTMNLDRLALLLISVRRVLPPRGRIFFGTFPSEVRPDFVTLEAMRLVRQECHNTKIVFGAQSGSEHMLESMRRGHTSAQVIQACSTILDAGMQPVVDFILGLPGETVDQMWETIALMEHLAKQGARIHLHAFMPLPGTPWAGREPSPIPFEVRRRAERLIAAGRLFGQWKSQERLASARSGNPATPS